MLSGPKYSKEQKAQFFELLDRDGSVRAAADAAGVNVHAAYSWVRQAGLVMQRRALADPLCRSCRASCRTRSTTGGSSRSARQWARPSARRRRGLAGLSLFRFGVDLLLPDYIKQPVFLRLG